MSDDQEVARIVSCSESIISFFKTELMAQVDRGSLSSPHNWSELSPSEKALKRTTLKRVYLIAGNKHVSTSACKGISRNELMSCIRDVANENSDDDETIYVVIRALRSMAPYIPASTLILDLGSYLDRSDVCCRTETLDGIEEALTKLPQDGIRRLYSDSMHVVLRSLIKSSEYSSRCSGTRLISLLYGYLDSNDKASLRNLHIQTVYDESIQVQREAAMALKNIVLNTELDELLETIENVPEKMAKTVDNNYISMVFTGPWTHSIYASLRKILLPSLPHMSRFIENSQIQGIVTKTVKDAFKDLSGMIRVALLDCMAELVEAFQRAKQDRLLNSLLIPIIQRGIEDPKPEIGEHTLKALKSCLPKQYDPDEIQYFLHNSHRKAEYCIPTEFCLVKDHIESFLKPLKQIVAGSNVALKVLAASMLSRIARTIDEKRVHDWLLPFMVSLLRQNENTEAHAEALKHAGTIYSFTKNTNASQTLIKESLELCTSDNWRVRMALASQFAVMASISIEGQFYSEATILDKLFFLVKDDVHAVRLGAIRACSDFIVKLGELFFLEKLLPQFLKLHGYVNPAKQASQLKLRSVCQLCMYAGQKLTAESVGKDIIPLLKKCLSIKVSAVRVAAIRATHELLDHKRLQSVLFESGLVWTILSSSSLHNPKTYFSYEKAVDVQDQANAIFLKHVKGTNYQATAPPIPKKE